jgi:replicative DNA helicase
MKTLNQVYDGIQHLSKNTEFLPTGLHILDDFLDGGFMRKELIVIGGFTGSGKSFISAQIFKNIADKGFKGAYFSLEISNEMVLARLIGQLSNIKATRIMAGLLTPEENIKKMEAKGKLATLDGIADFSDDVYDIGTIEEAIKVNEYDFIVLDFIQNLITKNKDEYTAMSEASIKLQKMAKEYNCCIIVLSQLSNSAYKNGSLEYKGSGGIAMVADLGFFIVRPKDDEEDKNKLILSLRKNRRGISGINFEFKFKTPGGMIL